MMLVVFCSKVGRASSDIDRTHLEVESSHGGQIWIPVWKNPHVSGQRTCRMCAPTMASNVLRLAWSTQMLGNEFTARLDGLIKADGGPLPIKM
jgi:hypothetical protein